MIDTIRMFTKNFELKPENEFVYQPRISHSTGEILSEKLYCNLPGIHIDLKQENMRKLEYCNLRKINSDENKTLSFHTSLPKVLHGTSLFEIQENDTERAMKSIENNLEKAGVYIDKNDLEDFNLSRIDFCRNIQVDNNIIDYLLYFDRCYFSRRLKTEIKKETVTYGNKSQQLSMYNKVKEILDTVKDENILSIAKDMRQNIFRIESRLLHKTVIDRELKKIDNNLEMKFENMFSLKLANKRILRELDSLVKASDEQLEFSFETNLQLMDTILKENKRNANIRFLACKSVQSFLKEFNNDFSKILEFYLKRFSRAQAYRNIGELMEFKNITDKAEQKNLLKEIKMKLAA